MERDSGNRQEYLIGVISDTHGLLREEVLQRLQQCDLIIHAGDIESSHVPEELRSICAVVAVKGNVDRDRWSLPLKTEEYVQCEGKNIYVLHNIDHIKIDVHAEKVDVVIFGHSHDPLIKYDGNILYFNPGSAGPKRFHHPVSMGYIRIKANSITPEIIEIEV
jgi:hypothetical protein